MPNWSNIDTVLLDMDGTLLDLYFDNFFWLEVIPKAHAAKQNISEHAAKADIQTRYQAVQGNIQWYCLDYWQQQLGLPIMELKHQHQHLIKMRDDTPAFLTALKAQGKRVILFTNAHPDSMHLKVELTQLDNYIDELVSSHQYGASKEHQSMWQQAQAELGFDKDRTLFIDDSHAVLEAAKKFGIAHLVAIANPDSTQAAKPVAGFNNITDFSQLLKQVESN